MIISGIDALLQTARLRKGKLAKLSIAQITNLIVNLPDAKKNLSPEEFEKVHDLYKSLRMCKVKTSVTASEYLSTATCIVKCFHSQAPFEKYSGSDPAETKMMLEEIERSEDAEWLDFVRFSERVILETQRTKRIKKIKKVITTVCLIIFGYLGASNCFYYASETSYSNGYDSGYEYGYDIGYEEAIIAQEYVYCTNVSRTYHSSDCVLLGINKYFYKKTEEEAKTMGYSACTVCVGKDVYETYEQGYSDGYEAGKEHAKLYYELFGSNG